MIIVPGVIHQESWYTTTKILGDYLMATSETSYNNDDLTVKWLAHFQRFSAKATRRGISTITPGWFWLILHQRVP